MEEERKIIGFIENGIVIDHIPFGKVWKIAEILGISKEKKGRVSLGDGFISEKIGLKGILKIEGAILSDYQLNLIALIAKDASVSVISSGKIVRKIKADIPKTLKRVVICPNLGCITNDNHEFVDSLIKYDSIKENFDNKGFICNYCNYEFGKEELRFKLF